MIDPKELRFGNYIFELGFDYNGDNKLPDGDDEIILFDEDMAQTIFAARDYENYGGIPLTTEILERCGFKIKRNGGDFNNYWRGEHIDLTEDMELSTSSHDYDSIPVASSRKISYLHELQNLHQALTGKELEVTL